MGRALCARIQLEDVRQEVWTKAWESIGSFRWRGKDSFRHWLEGIARNVVNDKARYYFGTQRRLEQSLDGDSQQMEQAWKDRRLDREEPTPSRGERQEERFARLAAAYERLCPDYREVLRLARLRSLSIRDVAARMNRTPGAVSSLLLRAVRELRKEFGSETGSFGLPDGRSLDGSGNGVGQGPHGGPPPHPLQAAVDQGGREPGQGG